MDFLQLQPSKAMLAAAWEDFVETKRKTHAKETRDGRRSEIEDEEKKTRSIHGAPAQGGGGWVSS